MRTMTSTEIHHMCEGELVVYNRPTSRTPNWYFRIRLRAARKWKKFTAKTHDLEKAKEVALRKFDVVRSLEADNYPVDGRRFDEVADLTIKRLEDALKSGTGKITYHDYIRVIKRYKTFFGKKYVHSVSRADMESYYAEIKKERKRRTESVIPIARNPC